MTSTATPSTAGERADRRAWLGLIALALPCMIVTMDLTVLFLALPQLTADLDPSATQQLWITDIYGFLIAGALILMGALGDRVGRRRVLLVGAAAFGAASALAALSTSPEMLIAARAIQGLAGATLVPSTMSLVFAMFRDERQRMTAIGIIMSCFMAGAALGPLVGGALLEFFDWHAVFLVNVPITLLLLAIGPRLLPEFRNPDAGRVDVPSAALLVSGILATIYAIKQSASHGVDTTTLAAMAGGVIVLAVFVVRQLRLDEPLLDVRLFASRVFSTALSGNVLAAFAMFGVSFFTTQYLQLIVGLSPLESGLASLPGIVVMMVCSSVLTPRLATRIRPGYLVAGGLMICVVGFGLIAQLQPGDGLGVLIPVMMLLHIGIAPASTLGSQLIVGAAPVERAGAASGVAQTGTEMGGALGIALLGTLGTAIYRDDVAAAIPADAPAQAATAAGESLGGAVHVAGQLPAGVLDAATAAFTQGLHAAAIACGLALLVSAVLSARFLRHIPPTGAAEQAAPEADEKCEALRAVPAAEAA